MFFFWRTISTLFHHDIPTLNFRWLKLPWLNLYFVKRFFINTTFYCYITSSFLEIHAFCFITTSHRPSFVKIFFSCFAIMFIRSFLKGRIYFISIWFLLSGFWVFDYRSHPQKIWWSLGRFRDCRQVSLIVLSEFK